MRTAVAILIALAAIGAPPVSAQQNLPPLLTPAPPGPTPPPLFVPPALPSANPSPPPLPSGYGTPPGISTATPLSSTPSVTYRQTEPRAPKKKRWKRRRGYQSSAQ